jgi:hypothetical protein
MLGYNGRETDIRMDHKRDYSRLEGENARLRMALATKDELIRTLKSVIEELSKIKVR